MLDHRSIATSSARYQLLLRIASVGLLLLGIVTWRIWIPTDSFPQIPLFAFACVWPPQLDVILVATVAMGLVFITIYPAQRYTKPVLALVCSGIVLLFVGDQHRIQPWAYLGTLTLAVGLGGEKVSFGLLRMLFVSVYVYSAINKIDYAFSQQMGRQFVETSLRLVNLDPKLVASSTITNLAIGLPIFELVVGFGLIVSRTRQPAVCLAVILHVAMIAVLGPLGLQHKPGVLIWNALFAIEVSILFWHESKIHDASGEPKAVRTSFGHRLAACLAASAILLPLLEFANIYDHWPSWALYSERTERIQVHLHIDKIQRLPADINKHVGKALPLSSWRNFYVEQWSLDATAAPVYPEDRYLLGLAMELRRIIVSPEMIRITVHSMPNRLTGKRAAHELTANELDSISSRFWLNVNVRSR